MSEFIEGALRRVERSSYLPSDVDVLANEVHRLTRERDEKQETAELLYDDLVKMEDRAVKAEARLAAVPALVEAAKDFQHSTSVFRLRRESRDQFVALVEALTAYEQAQG